MLKPDDLRSLDDRKIEKVDVSEWWLEVGDRTYVKSLSSRDRLAMAGHLGDLADDPDGLYQSTLVAHCLCNADGSRVLDPLDINNLVMLSHRNGNAIRLLYDVACRLNGIGSAAIGMAKKSEPALT